MSKMKKTLRDIKEFSTDGCTSSPDFDFRDCCIRHDFDYWGGRVTRKTADKRLKECIIENGHPYLARIYYAGVRLFGWRYYKYRRTQ